MINQPAKPSDFSVFLFAVYTNSATHMTFEQYFNVYEDVLKVLFFNHDIDLPLAIEGAKKDEFLS